MSSKYCIVMTTFETDLQANEIIHTILEKKMAACVQSIPISSQYYWDGKIEKDPEVLVLFKTKDKLYETLKKELIEIHPYETPEVLKISIKDGSREYLNWIDEVTINE